MRGNTITIELPLKRGKVSKTIPLYQYDYGQKLIITDVELPSYYEVHFSNEMHGDAVTSIGDSTGVEIPDSLLATGENVYLWLYLHESGTDGETEFQGAIPVIKRARVTDQTPTPHERTIIEQAVSALNSAVSDVEGKVEDAEAAQIAAEVAQAAAENAQSKAEDAQGAAETAQDAAEDAQTAAETAQGKAEDAQDAAETAQGKAEDAQGAAESAQSAAEGFAGNASDSADDAEAWAIGTEDSTHPAHGNSAKDWAEEAAEVVQGIIDDTAGDGDTDKTWSADKMHDQFALKADKWDPTIYGKISHGRKGGSTAGTNSAVIGGDNAVASGSHAVAEGQFTIAAGAYQRASGKFNVEDSNGTYAEIIGNGYAEIDPQTFVVTEHRSNARALDWNGNETLAGDLTVNKGKTNEMNLGSEVSNLKNEITSVQEAVGTDIVYKNSFTHTNSVSVSATKTLVHAEQGWNVKVNISDENNSSASFYLYVKYEEDSESSVIGQITPEHEYDFVSAKTLEYIGFYTTGLQNGTLYISASVNAADNILIFKETYKKIVDDLGKTVGTEIKKTNEIDHVNNIQAVASKTLFPVEQGWMVHLLLEDSTNSGFTYTIYIKYKEDDSSISYQDAGKEGSVYSFKSAKTLEYISVYATGLSAGTATITVTTENENGIIQDVSNIESIIYNGCTLIPANVNASFSGGGPSTSYNAKRLRTGLIEVKIGDEIYIRNGSLKHAVGAWKGTPSQANNIRNDGAFMGADEKIVSAVNGFYLIVFAKQDTTQAIVPEDFDGAVELYNTKVGRNSEASDVPSYYFTDDYITDKIDRINALASAGDDVFFFITDVHWERNAKNSPALINLLSKQCVIPRLFDGGDLADSINSGKIAIDSYASSYKNRIYRVVGNHDWFYPATAKSLYYWYNSNNNDQIGEAFGHYWYVDNVQAKIRYITLNSFIHTGSNNNSGWTYGYDADQIAWFTDEALNVPEGYDVIIFDHWFRNKQGGYTGYDSIESAIEAFNADTSSHGKVLCIFQGHAHWDAVFHTSSGAPVITTTCDKYDISNEPELSSEVRTLGTINEQAFEVVIVNRSAETITCVRIGAKAMDNVDVGRTDEGFTFAQTLDERVVSYATT